MNPESFIYEVYQRMASLDRSPEEKHSWEKMNREPLVLQAVQQYQEFLPEDKTASILDIGFGSGWFLAVCLKLGYSNLSGAELGANFNGNPKEWSPAIRHIYPVEGNIGDLLKEQSDRYEFIHISHVLEHVPKYSLLYIVDALFGALKKRGTLFVRTPNMEGPCALSSLFVTLAHEYGFCGSNLKSLLEICNFENIQFHTFKIPHPSLRQRLGILLRWPYLKWAAPRDRLFGVNYKKQFGPELIVSAQRGNRLPLFHEKFR
jgi:2-polyprenyl-3-methyl-5-hydroxy-6-metoxy-1,4-benzoquinol methylase